MAWLHPVARHFAGALTTREFAVIGGESYRNEKGVKGWRYKGTWRGRDFYISQSATEVPSPPQRIAAIISDAGNLDEGKYPLYQNEIRQLGLRVEAWYFGRWFQVFTPVGSDQPDDEFYSLAQKILIAVTVSSNEAQYILI
jgi:hypothetical protein